MADAINYGSYVARAVASEKPASVALPDRLLRPAAQKEKADEDAAVKRRQDARQAKAVRELRRRVGVAS